MLRLFDKKLKEKKLEEMLALIDELVQLSQGSFFEWPPPTEIVSGKAAGPDTVGEIWAMRNGLPVKAFPANWTTFGKAAGMVRNEKMAHYADHALILWDGKSSGTKNMEDRMNSLGKEYIIHNYLTMGPGEGILKV